ncbi:hypothetical protein ACFLYO_03675 [Chloroflexota bacterium]
MIEPHAFVFVKHHDLPTVGRAILHINTTRRQRFFYRSLILSEPQQGWIALLLGEGGGLVDHLLLRNLSGRLQTTTFELRLGRYDFAYRVHCAGQTVGAFESNLPYYVNFRLRMIESSNDVNVLDLGEPIERFALKRYHDLQHPTAAITLSLKIPEDVQQHYAGSVAAMKHVLQHGVDEQYVQSLLTPGFSPERAFENLLPVLDLPYIPPHSMTFTDEQGEVHRVRHYDLTKPATWMNTLPPGWKRMPSLPPKNS